MKTLISKLRVIKYIIPTIYFNFHYLPWKQAIYLPIYLFKPHLLKCEGKVILKIGEGKIRRAMIRLGEFNVSLYPNNGITFENSGTIVFKGKCSIGNDSYISVGKSGVLTFGNDFASTASLKLTSYHSITFGNKVLVGWNNLMMDTDFHRLKYIDGRPSPRSHAPIVIGDNCWIGANCMIMKGTYLPSKCVVGARSFLNRTYDCPEASIIAGHPAKLIKSGLYHDKDDDKIDYKNM
jgi:acetyltransferase-like isoleucine patch superfamily enzyme